MARAVVCTKGSPLLLRSGPSGSTTAKMEIPNGTLVEVLEKPGDWTRIRWREKPGLFHDGWVCTPFLRFLDDHFDDKNMDPEYTGKKVIVTTGGSGVHLRKTPDDRGDPIVEIPNKTVLIVITDSFGWVKVKHETLDKKRKVQHEGWINKNLVRPV